MEVSDLTFCLEITCGGFGRIVQATRKGKEYKGMFYAVKIIEKARIPREVARMEQMVRREIFRINI